LNSKETNLISLKRDNRKNRISYKAPASVLVTLLEQSRPEKITVTEDMPLDKLEDELTVAAKDLSKLETTRERVNIEHCKAGDNNNGTRAQELLETSLGNYLEKIDELIVSQREVVLDIAEIVVAVSKSQGE
jgi:hypothetical protein